MDTIYFNPSEKFGALTWSTEFQHFSAYHSDLGRSNVEVPYGMGNGSGLKAAKDFIVEVVNTKTNKKIKFQYFRTDYNGSGDDREVAGWRYKAIEGHKKPCELLIIND